MKKSIALLCLLAYYSLSYAQKTFKPVNNDEVKKQISDSTAATYYPRLTARLYANDTTLTIDEYRLIYYGFVYQKAYSPYSNYKDREIKEAFEKNKFDEVIKYCNEAIQINPAAIRSYYYKIIAMARSNQKDSLFEYARKQYFSFMEAIVSTGDGLTCKTAFKVIAVSDEYDVIYRYFEAEKMLSQSLEHPCDKMHISRSKYYSEENMYFDVSASFDYMNRKFKKE